jgi:hypothetical protein
MTMTKEDKKLNREFQKDAPKIELAMLKETCEKYKTVSHETLALCREIMKHWDKSERQWRIMYWIAFIGGVIVGAIAYNLLK